MLMLTQLFYISFGGEVSKRNFPKITKPGPCATVNLKRGTIVFFLKCSKVYSWLPIINLRRLV